MGYVSYLRNLPDDSLGGIRCCHCRVRRTYLSQISVHQAVGREQWLHYRTAGGVDGKKMGKWYLMDTYDIISAMSQCRAERLDGFGASSVDSAQESILE